MSVAKRLAGAFSGLALRAAGLLAVGLLAVAALAPSWGAPGTAESASRARQEPTDTPCFLRRAWRGGWKAAPDARAIYIDVSGAVYRLDLAGAYPLLRSPLAVLHNADASDAICTANDFHLTVTDFTGVVVSPIVTHLTLLTPAQVAALPPKLRP